jgi:transcriptional regulator with XRE-family HTH domain
MELSELRRKKLLTQQELADRLGVSRGAIAKWEAGQAVPYFKHQRAMAEIFGVEAEQIEYKGKQS